MARRGSGQVKTSFAAGCLTRLVIDDERSIEVAQLQAAMQRIQSRLNNVPPAQREYIANALLNLAVERMSRGVG
jgi:hypothetical protein